MKKVVIVTGASSGIGKEIAKELSRQSFIPLLVARREELLKNLSEDLKDAPYYACDLSEEKQMEGLKEFYSNLKEVSLYGLINNAGAYRPSSFLESKLEEWSFHFKVNLLSSVYLTQLFAEELKKTKGSVVNVSSTLGVRPIPNTSAYSASKAAMNSLTQSSALELAAAGIRVNAICPGIVDTPIHDFYRESSEEWKEQVKSMQPLGRAGEPKDIASLAAFLVSEKSSWMTGTLLPVDGGILLKS